jgi:hypothetical protein
MSVTHLSMYLTTSISHRITHTQKTFLMLSTTCCPQTKNPLLSTKFPFWATKFTHIINISIIFSPICLRETITTPVCPANVRLVAHDRSCLAPCTVLPLGFHLPGYHPTPSSLTLPPPASTPTTFYAAGDKTTPLNHHLPNPTSLPQSESQQPQF